MTAVTGGGAGSYTYDGNGLRVAKSAQGTTTVSIYSGSSVIAEYDNGAAPTSPSREYVDGPSGLLAMFSGGATTYYHQDHLSVRLTTDANGNVLSQQGSYPFGESWYQSGSANKWSFTNYQQDAESGLNYALARYYDSRTGTFCSADPLAGSPSDPQSWNRYPYGRNDPIDITDPSGKSWWSSLLEGIGIAVVAYFTPELAPGLFDAASDAPAAAAIESTTTTTLSESGTVMAISNAATVSVTATATMNPAAAAVVGAIGAEMSSANDALKQVQKVKFNKKPCRQDLNALHTTPQAMQAGAQNAQLFNGTTSNALRSSLYSGLKDAYASAQAQFGSQTISQAMAIDPNTVALSALEGNSIFVNPALMQSGTFWNNAANIAHEVAHNVTGLTDSEIQDRLGLTVQKDTTNISDKLKKDCF